jgi:hypothetical protein
MPGYTLVPVDYQPDFSDYRLVPVDYDPFAEDGPIQQARTQLASQPQTNAGFDQPPSAPQTPGSAPPLPPIVPNGGQAPSVPQPPGQDLHAQYQALRPMLGDRNAMLATLHPEIRQTLIAQALAGQQQPGQTPGPAPTGGGSGVTQQAQTQPQQPAPGAGQPDAGAPAAGDGPSGSGGGNGLSPGGSDVGGGPNPTSDQAGASEPLPFSGFANPTPAESLVNRQKMKDQMELAGADRTGNNGAISDGGETYAFVTTGPTRRYLTSDQTGEIIMATSPFYAYDGTRYAFIDASPARPLTVTIRGDGTFTISRP